MPSNIIDEVCFIVDNISWKNGKNKTKMRSLEGKVVQDADRLEALGAIGVARAFSYGGYRNRPMMESFNHFYEKLLLLKDRMHTKTGRKLATRRHNFMKLYLKEFYREWKGL